VSEHNNTPDPIDPLTVGELITLQEAADYSGLVYETLLNYVRRGRLKAKKRGWMWFTTKAAVDEYLASRDLNSIPKRHRRAP
jgi:excisionase family DNA binding protein